MENWRKYLAKQNNIILNESIFKHFPGSERKMDLAIKELNEEEKEKIRNNIKSFFNNKEVFKDNNMYKEIVRYIKLYSYVEHIGILVSVLKKIKNKESESITSTEKKEITKLIIFLSFASTGILPGASEGLISKIFDTGAIVVAWSVISKVVEKFADKWQDIKKSLEQLIKNNVDLKENALNHQKGSAK